MTNSTLDFLLQHAAQDPVSFHMPGHKGAQLYRRFGYDKFLNNIMDCDITEIPGADNLFQREGILKDTCDTYSKLYEVAHSYMLINGTSGGIIAAILASVEEGGTLIMARNCHKSVFNALTLGGMQPAYIYPELIEEYGISGEVTPQEVERAIAENPEAGAIILPSPNYYGICSDIRAIAEVAHRHGKILIVDQAHGAHLKWLNGPECAEAAGADIVINSIHKTLGSFTQSAVLNLNSKLVDRYLLEDKLQAIQSTSPSYLLMTSLEINARLLEKHQESLIGDWNRNLDFAYEELMKIPGLRVVGAATASPDARAVADVAEGGSGITYTLDNLDHSKINLDTTAWGITASELEEMLMEKGIFCELTTGNILMLMTGIGNKRSDFERLIAALKEIRAGLGIPEAPVAANAGRLSEIGEPAACATAGCLSEASEPAACANAGRLPGRRELYPIPKNKKRVKLEDAAGLICAGSIIPYPPGIPLICPGEKMDAEDLEYVAKLRANGEKVIGINEMGEVTVGADL